MPKKIYVLWIEDDATYNLQYIAAPVVMNPRYDLTLAITVSEALHHLQRRRYDVVVFDLRLPPGKEKDWVSLDQFLGQQMEPPRLGLHLLLNLYGVLDKRHAVRIPMQINPPPITQVGVLSVDSWEDVEDGLLSLKFRKTNYRQKRAGMPSNILLQLVEEMINNGH